MHGPLHPLDPNTIDFGDGYEHRIYADETLLTYAIVDQQDYSHFVRYCWCIKSGRSDRGKVYLRRAVTRYLSGQRNGADTLYLHIEILKRVMLAPSPGHIYVDHRNGNSLDCRRSNLRWVTPAMNNRNIRGSHSHDLEEFCHDDTRLRAQQA